mmetsp:Transcript_43819/g.115160  ORF Transcript_43819/g.115160 Transcript_43819/m.115160 type:complete len:396 (-) Transcript_43819:520-1707(-)
MPMPPAPIGPPIGPPMPPPIGPPIGPPMPAPPPMLAPPMPMPPTPPMPPPDPMAGGKPGVIPKPVPLPSMSAGIAPRMKAGFIWTGEPRMSTSPRCSAAAADAGRRKRQNEWSARPSGGMRTRRCLNLAPWRWNLMPPGASSPKTSRASATCISVACEGTRISMTVKGQIRRSLADTGPKSLAPGRGVLQRLHFSRKAKLILPQLAHFQSPVVDPGPLGIMPPNWPMPYCPCGEVMGSVFRRFASLARIAHASAAACVRPATAVAPASPPPNPGPPPSPVEPWRCCMTRSSWFWSDCSAWPTRCGHEAGASCTWRQRHAAACPSGMVRTLQLARRRSACVCRCSSVSMNRPLNSPGEAPCLTRRMFGKRIANDCRCSGLRWVTPPMRRAHCAPHA